MIKILIALLLLCSPAWAGYKVTGNLEVTGNAGIGTSDPLNKLQVVGTVQSTGFKLTTSPTAGYVLTSDSVGVGTWQPAAGGSSQWTGTTALYFNGNVGIGSTATPIDTLQVKTATGGVTIDYLPIGYGGLDAYTKLLIHADGSNGQTTYTAETSQTVTFAGTAQLSTAQQKFGASSLLLDGNSDYVTIPDSDDWNFGTGDYTIDFWWRPNSHVANQALCGQYVDASNFWALWWSNTGALQIYSLSGGTTIVNVVSAAFTPSNGTWYHIAITRASGTLKMFVAGTAYAPTFYTGNGAYNHPNIAAPLWVGVIGITAGFFYLDGNIDEIRISKGVARWTTDFTPPTRAYDNQDISYPSIKTQNNSTQTSKIWTDGSSANAFKIDVPSTTRLTIDANGNTGLGTTLPVSKLDIVGIGTTSATSSLIIRKSTGVANVTVLDNGNVGIGSATPTATLDVVGTVSMAKALVSKTIGTVYQAESDGTICGYAYSSSGTSNTAGYLDTVNPPTVVILQQNGTINMYAAICYRVPKNYYYKIIAGASGQSMSWLPDGK